MFTHTTLSQDKANPYVTHAKFVCVNAYLGLGPILSMLLFCSVFELG